MIFCNINLLTGMNPMKKKVRCEIEDLEEAILVIVNKLKNQPNKNISLANLSECLEHDFEFDHDELSVTLNRLLLEGKIRARFCLALSHTKEIIYALSGILPALEQGK